MQKRKQSQTEAIRDWLVQGHRLTPLDALGRWGCLRLAARIFDLRAEGLDIHSEIGEDGVAVYRLV